MRCGIDNLDHVNSILQHESIYPFITDDGSPSAEDFTVEPLLSNEGCYLLAPDEYSVFMFVPMNEITYDLHVNVISEGRGQAAVKSIAEATEWMFENTPCQKIIGYIPTICPNVYKFALKTGFEREGYLTKSWKKDGQLYDQYLITMTKENLK